MTQPIPEGFTTITPSLMFKDAAKAIDLYKKAFDAKEISRTESPDGSKKIMHACIQVGTSMVFLSDEFPGMTASKDVSFYLYVPDVDASMAQAAKAGLKLTMPAEDMFWGDRLGALTDEFGIRWSVATHIKDVSAAELQQGAKNMMEKMKDQKGGCPGSEAA